MSGGWYVTKSHMLTVRRLGPFEKRPAVDNGPKTYRARGRVFKVGNTWHHQVIVGGRIVDADNTGHWRTIFDGCNEAVYAFDLVLNVGHKIRKSYDELVDAAS